MLILAILVIVLLIGADIATIFVLRRSRRMERMAFAEVTSEVEPGERVLFKGSVSKMLLDVWPYVPVSGALIVTDRRLLWKQGEGVPVPFLLRTSRQIDLPDLEEVSNPKSVNPEMIKLTVNGRELRFFMNSLVGPKFTEENQRKPGELSTAIHDAKAAAARSARRAAAP